MYIDGDTHYWPLRFIDKVSHPGKGYVEVTPDKGDMIRFGEPVPGKVATYYRDGKKIHSFKEGRWSIPLRAEFMKKDGFDVQVLIPDNRPLIYEVDAGARAAVGARLQRYSRRGYQGDDRFIGCAWIYLPDIQESIRELRRAVKDLGMKAVKFNGGWGDGDLDNEVLWPLYEEIARLDIPILFHPAARVFEAQHSHPWLVGSERYQGLSAFSHGAGISADLHGQRGAADLSAACWTDFPTLKFAFFEGGIGWVPWLMQTLERAYAQRSGNFNCGQAVLRRQRKSQKSSERVLRSVLYRRRLVGEPICRDDQGLAQSQHHHRQRLRPRRRRGDMAENRERDSRNGRSIGGG